MTFNTHLDHIHPTTVQESSRVIPRPFLKYHWLMIISLWLGWWLILNLFQVVAYARLEVVRPDQAYNWTAGQTLKAPPADDLVELHARWDSGFYVTIALY